MHLQYQLQLLYLYLRVISGSGKQMNTHVYMPSLFENAKPYHE